MTFGSEADLLCSSLWEAGKYYSYASSGDGIFDIFQFYRSSCSYRCVKSGLSIKEVVDFLRGVQDAQA